MKIIGDYHTHSDNSDGKNTVEEMVRAAAAAGLTEMAITDHGCSKWFKGVKPKRYPMIKALVEKAGTENNVKTYFGVEANFTGTDGQIDVSTEDRDKVDILLCGVHRFVRAANAKSFFSFFVPNWFWWILHYTPKSRIRKNTEFVKRAIEKNNIDIWTHPNLYFKLDMVDVARTCAERGTLIELNSSHIAFRPIDFERMLATGAKFIIDSDSHSTRRVGAVDKVYEFLKSCDFKECDIVNLNGTFENFRVKWEKVKTTTDEVEVTDPKNEEKKDKKPDKRDILRSKVIKK
jgi:putative hydrolase